MAELEILQKIQASLALELPTPELSNIKILRAPKVKTTVASPSKPLARNRDSSLQQTMLLAKVPTAKTNPFNLIALLQPILKKEKSDGPLIICRKKREKPFLPSKKPTKMKDSTKEFTFKNQFKENVFQRTGVFGNLLSPRTIQRANWNSSKTE